MPLGLDELVERWTVLADDQDLIAGKRGPTRLGFALLLKFFTQYGRFPEGRSELPDEAVGFVARQVKVPASDLGHGTVRRGRYLRHVSTDSTGALRRRRGMCDDRTPTSHMRRLRLPQEHRMPFRPPRRAATLVLAGVLPLTAALFAGSTAPANAAVASIPLASVEIENVYLNQCLDGGEWFLGLGNVVTMDTCEGGYSPEAWEIVPHNGYYNIVPTAGGACLDGVAGTVNGVTLKPCVAGDAHQQWSAIRVNGAVINSYQDQANGLCLDATETYGLTLRPCSPANIPDTHQWFGGVSD